MDSTGIPELLSIDCTYTKDIYCLWITSAEVQFYFRITLKRIKKNVLLHTENKNEWIKKNKK